MRRWTERNSAVADLLNPALLSITIAAAASEYERRDGRPMPFALAFLVAPLVLHKATREELPSRVDSHLSKWVTSHEVLAAGFGARARALVGPVREGIRFGIRTGALEVVDSALVGHLRGRRPAQVGDIAQVVAKAGFVGRWLTQLDSPTTAFALLGVEP
ncbi:three component ABC system middle component [Marmoricola sp. URHB0036]|uniref:three component ABC system middle component n=1 Tax=Marmoricola sp. URHB0036 TaxID=1298863 RepID=UPI0004250A3D|nr:three component ABC system middle component [Marmoricola sp. URHB0036]